MVQKLTVIQELAVQNIQDKDSKKGLNMKKEYHILSLSGGKDSTALAFFIKENMPEIFEKLELVFCDTEQEIPETYEYLNKIEIFLNKKITILKPQKSFDHLISIYNHLPSITQRWCTVELKTKVFKKYFDEISKHKNIDSVYLYIGIRADEASRTESSKHNSKKIKAIYPFVDYGLHKSDIDKILEESGIGYSDYYKWRKRSGCYFCMFQSKNDWLNLYEHHPDLFKKAMEYEIDAGTTKREKRFGWNMDMALKDMIKPENIKKIKEEARLMEEKRQNIHTGKNSFLLDLL